MKGTKQRNKLIDHKLDFSYYKSVKGGYMNHKEVIESIKKAAEHPCLSDAAVRLFLILKFFHQYGTVSMGELQQETGHGRDKLRDAIERLEQYGFIKRKQNIELGRFGHYTYKTLQ